MMIENLSGISSVHSLDTKPEKKSEAEELRSIEESGEGQNTALDIDREKISKSRQERPTHREEENVTYNSRGDLTGYEAGETDRPDDMGPLDLVA